MTIPALWHVMKPEIEAAHPHQPLHNLPGRGVLRSLKDSTAVTHDIKPLRNGIISARGSVSPWFEHLVILLTCPHALAGSSICSRDTLWKLPFPSSERRALSRLATVCPLRSSLLHSRPSRRAGSESMHAAWPACTPELAKSYQSTEPESKEYFVGMDAYHYGRRECCSAL